MKMKTALLIAMVFISSYNYAQQDSKISSVSFVKIVNDNRDEALYYFQNNWKVLRDMALSKNYISSYELMETPGNNEASFDLILITTYTNEEQYNLRETHFEELIIEKGDLKLLNNKKPEEFRKTLFTRDRVKHWN